MYAAIKVLEDTLLIRRLQAREFEGGHGNEGRLVAVRADIASLERGLSALKAREADAGRQTPDSGSEKTKAGHSDSICSACAESVIVNQQLKIENS